MTDCKTKRASMLQEHHHKNQISLAYIHSVAADFWLSETKLLKLNSFRPILYATFLFSKRRNLIFALNLEDGREWFTCVRGQPIILHRQVYQISIGNWPLSHASCSISLQQHCGFNEP
uniref:Uncharacterized protein n=1 Tax=Caenorhabditis japonica TaxID=281687 RepID=A0A8R1IZK8_CAEJA